MIRLLRTTMLLTTFLPMVALAHYPWYLLEKGSGKKDGVIFVFEDGLVAKDGEYLDPFIKNATYWLRTAEKNEPAALQFEEVKKDGKRWLTFPLEASPSRAIDCYCKWGVYQGKLLHYYARHLEVASAKDLAKLARAEKLRFDLVPRLTEGKFEVQVLWDGKPAAGKSVLVLGPKLNKSIVSDEQGIIRFDPEKAGRYALRTYFVEPDPTGTDNEMPYRGVRQTATLSITLPVPTAGK